MPRDRTFRTTLSLGIFDGGEFELSLIVTYCFTKAYPATAIDPGEPASAEIQKVRLLAEDGTREFTVPQWLESLIETDEALHDSLVADALEDDANAREAAAEARAEDRRMEPSA